MFIVTAQIVRPVNPDSLPQMKGVDDLKSGSPLDKTEKGDGLTGKTGFSTNRSSKQEAPAKPAAAPASAESALAAPNSLSLANQAAAASKPAWQAANYALTVPPAIVEAARARSTTEAPIK